MRKMGKAIIKIPLVSWRNGRPRFIPGPKHRQLGFKGQDLRQPDGTWFSVDEALAWSRAKQADIAALVSSGPKKARKRRTGSVGEIIIAWLATPRMRGKQVVEGRKSRRPLSANTVRSYKGSARLVSGFDDGKVWAATAALLTPRMMGNIIDKIEQRHGLAQARAVRAMLSACFAWAVREGRLRTNPVTSAAALPTLPPRVRYGSIEGMKHLIATADAMDLPEIGDLVMLALWTAQRQNDRLNLLASQRTDQGLLFKQSKKHGAPLLIPEAPELTARLKQNQLRRKGWRINYTNVVICERTKRPFSGDWYRKQFARVRAVAIRGWPEKNLQPCPELEGFRDQDLRDTAVTWMALGGTSKFEIAAITGHSLKTIDEILKHYLGMHPDMARSAIGKLITWYDKELEK